MSEPMHIQKVEFLNAEDTSEINKRLSEGWKILETASGKDERDEPLITVLIGLPEKDLFSSSDIAK